MKNFFKKLFCSNSMSKHFSETVQRIGKNNAGFSLVELIVVIAIMAILAAVAVVGVSVYIPKAQQANDKQLVSDIVNALNLQYYDSPDKAAGAYVIITTDGIVASEGYAAEALANAFGSDWNQSDKLKLAYDGWSNDGLLQYVLANADSAELIANSTYLTTATPEGLMNAVTNLTGAASDVIKNYGSTGGNVENKLSAILSDEFVTKLNNTGVSPDDDEYETVISNMLVGHFAGVLNDADTDEVMQDTGMVGMMMSYATVYAYCQTIGDTTTMENIDAYLSNSTNMDDLTTDAFNNYLQQNCSEEFLEGYVEYTLGEDGEGGRGYDDVGAALEIMGAVGHISGSYTDLDSLSNANLYSSDSVSEQLNNYISAIKAVSKMDSATVAALNNMGENAVAIFVAEDGTVSVIPGAIAVQK